MDKFSIAILVGFGMVIVVCVYLAIVGFSAVSGFEPNATEDRILDQCISGNITAECSQLYGGPVYPAPIDQLKEMLGIPKY